uniref:Putative amino acid transporter n=1 Tax=Xenopsylla cheopis TaxID=163159 RepID=A0A6M2DZE5_XENCH
MTYFSAGCVYIVFIATSIGEVANHYIVEDGGAKIEIRIYILMVIVPLLIIGQIKELKYLVPFSAIANLCLIVSFAITLYYLLKKREPIESLDYMGEINTLPLFFSTVIFAMEGIGVVMPVENSMKKPQHFLGCPGVLNCAMLIVIILYTIIGFFGYWCYGHEVKGSITENLPVGEELAQTVKILIGLSILFTFGLQFYVPTSLLWGKIGDKVPKHRQNLVQIAMRIVIIFLMLGLALAVPDLEPFIGLVGAVFFSILGLTVPSVVETVHRWNGRLGKLNWIFWKNLVLFIFSMFALITGSITSIEKIIELY